MCEVTRFTVKKSEWFRDEIWKSSQIKVFFSTLYFAETKRYEYSLIYGVKEYE